MNSNNDLMEKDWRPVPVDKIENSITRLEKFFESCRPIIILLNTVDLTDHNFTVKITMTAKDWEEFHSRFKEVDK